MKPPDTERYLRAVARGLRDLGPFERRRALKEVRADLTDLAMDGTQAWPSSERMQAATRAMPPPQDVARSYLSNAPPPAFVIRVSLLLNFLLCLGPLAFGVLALDWIRTAPPGGGPTLPALLGAVGLVVTGGFGTVIYGIATVLPKRALRWRYAVLPAAGIAVAVDFILGIVAAVALGVMLPLAVFPMVFPVWCAYNVAYSHGQLPRLAPETPQAGSGDYFRALARSLQDLDGARRRAIADELRSHLAAAGVHLASLPPPERRAATERLLGPPEVIAAKYVEEADAEAHAHRRAQTLATIVTVPGLVVSVLLFGVGLNASPGPSWLEGTSALTALGILGSAGLLVVSGATLVGLIRVRRAPATWPDVGPPMAAFALAAALVLAAVLGGMASGGLTSAFPAKSFTVDATYAGPGGTLDAFWSWGEIQGGPFGGNAGPREGGWLTHLDAQRNLLGTEPVPFSLPGTPLLSLRRAGGTWEALFANRFDAWGAQNLGAVLGPPPGWSRVAGQLGDTNATIVWAGPPSPSGILSLRYDSFEVPRFAGETTWDRTYAAPGWQEARLALGEDRVLAVTIANDRNETYAHAEALAFLLDGRGNAIANDTLFAANVTRNAADDTGNATGVSVTSLLPVTGGFWVIGTSWFAANGNGTLRLWAARIDAADGSVVTQELHRFDLPAPHSPPLPGERSIAMTDQAVGWSGGAFIASSIRRSIINASGGYEVDPTFGGQYATGLRADGTSEFSVELGVGPAGIPFSPLLAAWGSDPIVVVPHFFAPSGSEDILVDAYEVPAPARAVQHTELTMRQSSALLLYLLATGPSAGTGVAPGIAEFAGQVLMEDCGFLGWRQVASPSGCLFAGPGLVRIDARNRTSAVVLLGPAAKPPDTVAQMLETAATTALLSVAVWVGYPRLRVRRNRPRSEVGTTGNG